MKISIVRYHACAQPLLSLPTVKIKIIAGFASNYLLLDIPTGNPILLFECSFIFKNINSCYDTLYFDKIYFITFIYRNCFNSRQCPPTLMAPLQRIILEEVQVASKKHPNEFGFNSDDSGRCFFLFCM